MKFSYNQTLNGIAVILLTIALLAFILVQLRMALRKSSYTPAKQKRLFNITLTGIGLWLMFLTIGSINEAFSNFTSFPPPIMPLILLPPLAIILFLTLSGRMDEILRHMSPRFLTGIQLFRVFVELILWVSFVNGYTPVQMTFEGMNHDIYSGIFGGVLALVASTGNPLRRKIVLAYNMLGLALLINIVTIAILSFPSPIRYFDNDPANTLVTYFPFIFIPAVFVPVAYTFHAFSLRQLKITRSKNT